MTVRPRAPPQAQLLRRLESRGAGARHAHPGWEHFQIITIIFPQWRLQGEFICAAGGADGAGVACWVCGAPLSLPGQRAPARASLTCSHWLQLGSIHVGIFSSLFRRTFPLLRQFQTGHQQLCEPQNLQHEAKLPVIFSWRTCEMAGWRPGCSIQTPVNSNSNINFVARLIRLNIFFLTWAIQKPHFSLQHCDVWLLLSPAPRKTKQNKPINKGHFLFRCCDSRQVFPHLNGQ